MSFLVFAGDHYYPSGGWGDFQKSFYTLDEATAYLQTIRVDWWQVVDVDKQEVVASGHR